MNLDDFIKEKLKNSEFKQYYDEYIAEYEIIETIKKTREEQHMTQKDLAEKTGLKQSNISRLESGEYNPSIAFLKRIAKALNKELYITLK